MLPTNCLKAEINGQTYNARRAYRPMSDAVKTKTSPLNSLFSPLANALCAASSFSKLGKDPKFLIVWDCKYSNLYASSAKMFEKSEIKFASLKNVRIFAILFREHSSVGLEHLPYKQRVGGSTPSAPTRSLAVLLRGFFVSNLAFVVSLQVVSISQQTFVVSLCKSINPFD